MSAEAINQAVSQGLPIEFIEGDDKEMGLLKKFVSSQAGLMQRLNPSRRTTLRTISEGRKPKPTAPAENKLALARKLATLGVSFETALYAAEATPTTLKKIDGFAEVAKALGLKGNAKGAEVYSEMRKESDDAN